MRLTIFGATGRTGRHLVEQGLAAGHNLVAVARDPSRMEATHERLSVVRGDILEPSSLTAALGGADAVLSVLGPSNNEPTYTISRGMANILSAMDENGVRRLVQSVGAGVRFPQDRPGLVDRGIGALLRLVAANVYENMRRTAAQIVAGDRDWTLVRVPMLTDGPASPDMRVGYLGEGVGKRLSRAGLAAFMLRVVEEDSFVREAPVISD